MTCSGLFSLWRLSEWLKFGCYCFHFFFLVRAFHWCQRCICPLGLAGLLSFLSVWVKFGVLLKLIGSDEPHTLSCPFSVQRREQYFYDFVFLKKCWHVFGHSWTVSFKLHVMIETSKLHIVIPVWMTLTFIWSEIRIFCVHFLANFSVALDKIWCVATTCWFVEVHAKFITHA